MLTSLQSRTFLCYSSEHKLRNLLDVMHELVIHVLHDAEHIKQRLCLRDLLLKPDQILLIDVVVSVVLDDLVSQGLLSR